MADSVWPKFAVVAAIAAVAGYFVADHLRISRELEAEKQRRESIERLAEKTPAPSSSQPVPPAPVSTVGPSSAPKTPPPEPIRRTSIPPPAADTNPFPPPTPDESKILFRAVVPRTPAAFYTKDWEDLYRGYRAWGPDGIAWLQAVLRKEGYAERFLAAALVGALARSRPECLPILGEALAKDSDILVRRTVSASLSMDLRSPDVKPYLEKALEKDPDPGVRVNAAYGLAKMGRRDAVEGIVRTVEDPAVADVIRTSAFEALVDLADPSTAAMFRGHLKEDEEPSIFLASVQALRKMKDRESLPALKSLIETTKQGWIAREAKRAYNAISGEEAYR